MLSLSSAKQLCWTQNYWPGSWQEANKVCWHTYWNTGLRVTSLQPLMFQSLPCLNQVFCPKHVWLLGRLREKIPVQRFHLGWECVSIVVESWCLWIVSRPVLLPIGYNIRLAITMLNSIYSRLSLLLARVWGLRVFCVLCCTKNNNIIEVHEHEIQTTIMRYI